MILLDCCAHFNKTKLNQKMTARHTKSIGLVRIQMAYLTVCKDLHRRIRNASKKYGLCNRDTWSEDGGDGNSHAHTNEHLTTVLQAAKKYCLPVTKLIAILLVQIHFSFGSMSLCSILFRMRGGAFDVDERVSKSEFLPLKFETIISISSVFAKIYYSIYRSFSLLQPARDSVCVRAVCLVCIW